MRRSAEEKQKALEALKAKYEGAHDEIFDTEKPKARSSPAFAVTIQPLRKQSARSHYMKAQVHASDQRRRRPFPPPLSAEAHAAVHALKTR